MTTSHQILRSRSSLCVRLLQVYSPSLGLIQQFAGDPDEHAVGEGRLETRLCKLVEHFGHSKTVVLPEVVQQAKRVVLEDIMHTQKLENQAHL